MKLESLEVFVVENQPPGWGGRYFIFVKLVTSCGITGFGEVYSASVGPEAMKTVIQDVFERHMLGSFPGDIELMFRRAYSSGFTQRPDLTVIGAFSGLEIACWDIMGKAYNLPVYSFLGGLINKRIRTYSYIYPLPEHDLMEFWSSPEMNAESALNMVDQGFTAVKFDPAGPYTIYGGHQPSMRDIEQSVAFCRTLREAIGDKADLLFGTHGQFTTSGAIRLANVLEEFSPLWFEEPIPPDNLDEFARISKACRIPIATGERLTTKAEFSAVLKSGGASILQPALGRSGGILETKKIAAIAEVFNASIAPHLYAGPVEWAANIQLAACIPNFLILETIGTGGDFHRQLIGDIPIWEKGYVIPPKGPGLGIDFNEELARSLPYTGKKLHLEMQNEPCRYDRSNSFAGGAPPKEF